MKIEKKWIVLIVMGIMILVLDGYNSRLSEREQQEELKAYWAILDDINKGNYEEAMSALEKDYGRYDSIEEHGKYDDGDDYCFNKMQLYRICFDKQEMYDEEMVVLLNYLKTHDFKEILSEEESSVEKISAEVSIEEVNRILDHVSVKLKEDAIELIGKDLLENYR